MAAMLSTTCWLVLEPTFRQSLGYDPVAVKMSVTGVRKKRPENVGGMVVKLTVKLPAAAFAPPAPEVVIEVPEDALVLPTAKVTVEVP